MAADVRDELDAVGVAHEGLRVVARLERAIVADVRRHQLVSDVGGRAREQQALLGGVDTRDRNTRRPEAATLRAADAPAVARSDIGLYLFA